MLPSDTWKTAEHNADDFRGAHPFWLRIPFDEIERVATSCRAGDVLCVANRRKYAAGMFCIAIELVFADGEVWIARLTTNHYRERSLPPDIIAQRMRSEVATMKLVAEKTAIPVAKVFAFCPTSDNPIGWPYVLMSAIVDYKPEDLGIEYTYSGKPLAVEMRPLFDTFCASLAEVISELKKISFDAIGSVYLDDQGDYVIGQEAETRIARCTCTAEYCAAFGDYFQHESRVHEKPSRLFGVWLLRLFLSTLAFKTPEPARYHLTHQDLHTGNIIVDSHGKIVGVLDWDTAACLPAVWFAAQAIDFTGPIFFRGPTAERESWVDIFSRALTAVVPTVAVMHATVSVKLLWYLQVFPLITPEELDNEGFLEDLCGHVLGIRDWKAV